jgi:hypothetical protein
VGFSLGSTPFRPREGAVITKSSEASPKAPRNVISPRSGARCGPPVGFEPCRSASVWWWYVAPSRLAIKARKTRTRSVLVGLPSGVWCGCLVKLSAPGIIEQAPLASVGTLSILFAPFLDPIPSRASTFSRARSGSLDEASSASRRPLAASGDDTASPQYQDPASHQPVSPLVDVVKPVDPCIDPNSGVSQDCAMLPTAYPVKAVLRHRSRRMVQLGDHPSINSSLIQA